MSVDFTGLTTINAAWGTGFTVDARIAPTTGSTGTIDIVSGGIFNTNGETRYGEDGDAATINVQVGGELFMDSECLWNEGEIAGQVNRLNVYDTAFIQQMKVFGIADDDKIVIGNGTDLAVLTIDEGLLGRDGDAQITINPNGIMVIDGNSVDDWKIDGDDLGTDSFIDLVGGTLKVADVITESNYIDGLIGFGGTAVVNSEAGSGPDAGFTIFTAEEPASDQKIPEYQNELAERNVLTP